MWIMSQTSLDALAEQHPDLREAIRRVGAWLTEHPNQIIIPSKVGGVDAFALASALMLLTRKGFLHRLYKVKTPSGVYADGEFEDVAAIPPRLADRFNNYFDTADADITPVFARGKV
jgi:hypothetical protein